MVIEAARLHFLAPSFDCRRSFLLAALIEPFDYFLVARTLLDLRLKIRGRHTFETEKHIIERTIEVIFADVACNERAALVNCAPENGVAANANSRTARRFFR